MMRFGEIVLKTFLTQFFDFLVAIVRFSDCLIRDTATGAFQREASFKINDVDSKFNLQHLL